MHLIAGTRPEAIKLAPLASALAATDGLRPVLVGSGQHPEMVDQALAAFGMAPDVRIPVRRRTGGQAELVSQLVVGLDAHLAGSSPAAVVVQGDTSTTLAGALAAYWRQLPIVHLEAGLRSGDLHAPFPEEGNRRVVDQLSALLLAPTGPAAAALRAEGLGGDRLLVTGNTVVDAVRTVSGRRAAYPDPRLAEVEAAVEAGDRLLLVTVHRRESWGEPLDNVLTAVRDIVDAHPDVRVVLPAHPNPAVRAQVDVRLGGLHRVVVTDPLPYEALARLLPYAHLVLSDSGGICEEAPSFGVPVLILRYVTERIEAVRAGCAKLVGTDPAVIRSAAAKLLDDPAARAAMVAAGNPFGDGRAAERSADAIRWLLGRGDRPDEFRDDQREMSATRA